MHHDYATLPTSTACASSLRAVAEDLGQQFLAGVAGENVSFGHGVSLLVPEPGQDFSSAAVFGCARAATGRVAAALASSVMNWRRLRRAWAPPRNPLCPAHRRLRMHRKQSLG